MTLAIFLPPIEIAFFQQSEAQVVNRLTEVGIGGLAGGGQRNQDEGEGQGSAPPPAQGRPSSRSLFS